MYQDHDRPWHQSKREAWWSQAEGFSENVWGKLVDTLGYSDISIWSHIYIYIYDIHICIYIWLYMCIYVYIYMYIYMYIYICNICVYIYMYIYVYIYDHNQKEHHPTWKKAPSGDSYPYKHIVKMQRRSEVVIIIIYPYMIILTYPVHISYTSAWLPVSHQIFQAIPFFSSTL